MSYISCHVLDTTQGRPAAGIAVELWHPEQTVPVDCGVTDSDGRVRFEEEYLESGIYTLHFATRDYCLAQFGQSFYPRVDVHFELNADQPKYHIPLLLSPYAYSTYRGS
jgi:5-hydroxyisourate hydrolase